MDDISIVLCNDHFIELDCPKTEPSPNFPSDFDLTIDGSSNIRIDEPSDSIIELEVGVPYESNLWCRSLDSHNDEFVLIDFIIIANYDFPIEFYLIVYRLSGFGVNEYFLVNSTKVIYIFKNMKVDDTQIQVNMNIYLPLYLLHRIVVLLFLQYRTFIYIPRCLCTIFSTFLT